MNPKFLASLVGLAWALAITGCATSSTEPSSLAAYRVDGPSATVVLLRWNSPPYAWSPSVSVDNQTVATIKNGSGLAFPVGIGRQQIRIAFPAMAASPSRSVEINARAGETYFLGLSSELDLQGGIVPATGGATGSFIIFSQLGFLDAAIGKRLADQLAVRLP